MDIQEQIRRTGAILTHPYVFTLTRMTLKLLRTLIVVCGLFIILGTVQRFTIRTVQFLYTTTSILLLLHIISNIYYTMLFLRHYARIRCYMTTYWYRTRARVVLLRAARVVCAAGAMATLLTIETLMVPAA